MKGEKESKKAGACRHTIILLKVNGGGEKNVDLLLQQDALEFHTAITAYLE